MTQSTNSRLILQNNIFQALKTNKNILGCISEQTDTALETVGYINSEFSLKGPQYNETKMIKNKILQRFKASENGIPQPVFAEYEKNSLSLEKFKHHFSGVKHLIVNQGLDNPSRGVSEFETKKVIDALEKSVDPFRVLHEKYIDLIIEEKIDGEDVSVDGFILNTGVFITIICKKIKHPLTLDRILIAHPVNIIQDVEIIKFTSQLVRGFRT